MEGNGRKDTDFCVIKIQELTGSRSIWKCSGKGGLPPNITFHLKKNGEKQGDEKHEKEERGRWGEEERKRMI